MQALRILAWALLLVIAAPAQNAYITFKGVNAGITDGFYPTQALANAAASDNADIVAHVGEIDISGFQPNKAYFDGTSLLPDIPLPIYLDSLPELDKFKATCWATHGQLMAWAKALDAEGVAHPASETALGHSYLAFAHQWMFLVMNNHRKAGNADWTIAQRETAAQLLAQGALDVVSPFTFFMALHLDSGAFIGTPTGPVGWVNVGSGARVDLSGAIATTNDLALDGDQLPSSSIADGSWIDDIAQ